MPGCCDRSYVVVICSEKTETNMKPSDFFIGVIDFFSTLVPGAIATYFLITLHWDQLPTRWPYIERGSPEGWAVFILSAYVLGHLIAAVGSSLLDPLYDRVYARWRRSISNNQSLRKRLTELPDRVRKVWYKTNPDDELLATAKVQKAQQLEEVAESAGVPSDRITNTFWWAGTVLRIGSPAGAAEVDALSAQSKLFRSITMLLPFAAWWVGWFETFVILGWIAVLLLSLWRFLRLRWDATERTYEYFIAMSLFGSAEPDRERPSRNKILSRLPIEID